MFPANDMQEQALSGIHVFFSGFPIKAFGNDEVKCILAKYMRERHYTCRDRMG